MDWSFLNDPAGFGLSEGWIAVSLSSSYWWLIAAGFLNTLKVALPSLLFCTLLGALIGVGRLSSEPAVRHLCGFYVGLLRNTPLLLQLLAIYFVLTQVLPNGYEAWILGGFVFLSKSGLAIPAISYEGLIAPVQGRFTVQGGWLLTPEWLAVFLALSLYTASFVAEVVRAGLQSVPKGLIQGGLALGLTKNQVTWGVRIPVALRLIIPSLSNQYLNLFKNASLGVVIGYPELVSVANTSMNQSGRALECVVLILVVYAVLSLVTSLIMNAMNQRVNKGTV